MNRVVAILLIAALAGCASLPRDENGHLTPQAKVQVFTVVWFGTIFTAMVAGAIYSYLNPSPPLRDQVRR